MQLTDSCKAVSANSRLVQQAANFTLESCVKDLLNQTNYYATVVCERAEDDQCTNPVPFDAICKMEGTDKSSFFHGFAGFYDQKLSALRPSSVLELGVLRGASLGAWAIKYPCARVKGLDAFSSFEDMWPGRYVVARANQESAESLLKATEGEMFDLIIDDGGHSMFQQQTSLATLWDKLNPCGAFVIEVTIQYNVYFNRYCNILNSAIFIT